MSETVPSEGQMLSQFIDKSTMDESVVDLLLRAEDELFSDPSDTMVNWTSETLTNDISAIEGTHVHTHLMSESPVKKLFPKDVEYWFRVTADGERKSLGKRLEEYCTTEQIDKIKRTLHTTLDNKDMPWRTVTMIITIRRK